MVKRGGFGGLIPMATGFLLLFLAMTPPAVAQSRAQAVASVVRALQERNFQSAVDLARSSLRRFPNDPQLLAMEGLGMSGLGNDRGALAAYESALRVAPEYLPALEGAAQIEYNSGSANAAPLLERILKLRPDDATTHAMLGVMAYKRHDCKEAVAQFGASSSILASQPAALEEYGFCLVQQGQPGRAVQVYATLLAQTPRDPQARIRLAAAQLIGEEPREALATLDPLLGGSDPNPQALDMASTAAEKIGQTPRAVSLLHQAIVLDPRNVNFYLDFATLAFDHQSFRTGVDMVTVGLSYHPRSAPLYLARGILYVQLADYAKADSDFAAAERLDPGQAFSSESESLAEMQAKGPVEALGNVRSQLKQHPDDPVLLYLLSDALVRNGARPGRPDFQEALHADERAVALKPHLILARDLLSKLYFDDGDYAKAIVQCRLALRDDPTDQEALYRLTQALPRTGSTAEIPSLLKRLAQLREVDRKSEAQKNRYMLTVIAPGSSPQRH